MHTYKKLLTIFVFMIMTFGFWGFVGDPVFASHSAPQTITVDLNPQPVNADGVSTYSIFAEGYDDDGGADITSQYAMVNYQGPNAGSYRGYVGWSNQGFQFTAPRTGHTPISCTGGGSAVELGGSNDYGSGYINLISCSTSVSGNYRDTVFTVSFNSNFTAPTANNTLSTYLADSPPAGYTSGWWPYDTFNLGTPSIPAVPTGLTATPSSCGTGTINVSWNTSSGATSYSLRDGATVIYTGSTNSFSHTGLSAGSSHSYTVRAENSNGNSSYSSTVSGTAPSACAGTYCDPMTPNSWIGIAGTCSYGTSSIQSSLSACVSTCTSNSATACEWDSSSQNCYPDSGSGCFIEGGHPGWYAALCSSSPPSIPAVPTGLTATPSSCGTGTINVSWNTSSGATSYSLRDGATVIYTGSTNSFSHTGLSAGSSHSYTVRAENSVGNSSYSSAVSGTAPSACAGTPDLTAALPAPSIATVNVARTYTSTISNIGGASTGASFSNFFQSATAANGGGTVTDQTSSSMATLGNGASSTATSPSIIFTSIGTYSIRTCADKTNSASSGVIAESNESNNCSAWTNVTVSSDPGAPQCGVPDTLGDAVAEIFGTSGEPTLAEVASNNGFALSAQKQYQTWHPNTGSTTIEFTFLSSGAAAGNVFGYYNKGQTSSFVPLFRNNTLNTIYTGIPVASAGQVYTVTIPAGDIGFAMHSQYGGPGFLRTSENSLNVSSGDYMVAYDITNDPSSPNYGVYMIGFEDLSLSTSDKDYNDMVVKVKIKSCQLYTVTGVAGANGSIDPSSRIVSAGSVANFTVTPNFGYTASTTGCSGSPTSSQSAAYTYTTGAINANCTVSANFSIVSASMSGTLTPAPPTSCTIAMGGTSCTKSLTWTTTNPQATSAVTSPTGTPSPGNSVNNGTQTFTVPYNASGVSFYLYNNAQLLAQTNVTTNCASGSDWVGGQCQARPTITAVQATNGVISPVGVTSVVYGANSTTYFITPNSGYNVASHIVNGVSTATSEEVYTFNNITSNQTISATFVVTSSGAVSPTATNVTINPKPVNPNGSNTYNIVATGADGNGGADITSQYAMVNFQGANAGSYRGYVGWSNQGFQFTGTRSTPIACSGGGSAAKLGGPSDFGDAYVNLLSCSTAVSGNSRTTTFTISFNPAFTAPTTSNTLSTYVVDLIGNFSGWFAFETFSLGSGASTPTITTSPVTNITQTTATGGGNITSNGGAIVTVSGIVWSTSVNPTTALSTKTTDGWAIGGPWASNMTGLTASTLYHVRAYATNSVGTAYGADVTFTTGSSAGGGPYTVTATAGPNGTISPSSRIVSSGDTTTFNITPDFEYLPSITTTCGTGLTYSPPPIYSYATGPITYNCSVSVTFIHFFSSGPNPPVTINATIYPKPINPNGSNAYVISAEAADEAGFEISSQYVMVNYQGVNSGSYRGYIGWSNQGFQFSGGTRSIPIACNGGGSAAKLGGSSDFGDAYINLLSCSTGVGVLGSINSRTSTFTVSFNPVFTSPSTNNTLSSYAADSSGLYSGWSPYEDFNLVTLPTITTSPVTNITQTTATGGGNITSNGGAIVTVSGIVWSTSVNPTTALSTKTTDGWAIGGPWASNMTGLTASTLYHVRAYATNSVGTAYGADVTFTTGAVGVPSTPTSLSATPGACSSGTIALSWNASSGATTYSLRDGATVIYTGSTVSFSHTGLTAGSAHSYSVRAGNGSGNSAYSSSVSATAPSVCSVPTVVSPTATNVTPNSALLGATVSSNGGSSITAHGICLGTGPSPLSCQNDGAFTIGPFNQNRFGLNPSTLYYYRGYATNSIGTGYSVDGTFTTLAAGAISASLSVSPDLISPGASSTLTWFSTNTDYCTSNFFSGNGATSGSTLVSPAATTTYSVVCTKTGVGQASDETTLYVVKGGKRPIFRED